MISGIGDHVNSNTIASRNGRTIETTICDYLGITHNCNDIVDAELDGHPLEIKSCQEIITDSSRTNCTRKGRFQFNEKQDRFLKENDGIYCFVVHLEGEIKHTCLRKGILIDGVRGIACGKTWTGVLA